MESILNEVIVVSTNFLVLVGQDILNYKASALDIVPKLSNPGELCSYYTDLKSPSSENPIANSIILYISTDKIEFPETRSILINTDKITR